MVAESAVTTLTSGFAAGVPSTPRISVPYFLRRSVAAALIPMNWHTCASKYASCVPACGPSDFDSVLKVRISAGLASPTSWCWTSSA